jgi:hypothetical protein
MRLFVQLANSDIVPLAVNATEACEYGLPVVHRRQALDVF